MKSRAFRSITASPLNGAPTGEALIRSALTDVADFFVRNHGTPPGDNLAGLNPWTVRVHGLVERPFDLALPMAAGEFGRHSVEATLQCAGNRRTALQAVRPIPNEIPWDNSAIGTALWGGIRLVDVLAHAGILDGASHVCFTGGDELQGKHAGEAFGGSIPLTKALEETTLLADSMNGGQLPLEHGAPIRLLVPGYIGARSVKWLREIRIASEPTTNHFQRAYSVFPPGTLSVPEALDGGRELGEFPLSSAFGQPVNGATVPYGATTMRGWAIAGGENVVERVEVSADGGTTWLPANFEGPPKRHVWRLWNARCVLEPGEHQLVCRAFDNAGNTQPADPRDTWNVKGYANNCWDRMILHVQ
jgi:sulfite oxidase